MGNRETSEARCCLASGATVVYATALRKMQQGESHDGDTDRSAGSRTHPGHVGGGCRSDQRAPPRLQCVRRCDLSDVACGPWRTDARTFGEPAPHRWPRRGVGRFRRRVGNAAQRRARSTDRCAPCPDHGCVGHRGARRAQPGHAGRQPRLGLPSGRSGAGPFGPGRPGASGGWSTAAHPPCRGQRPAHLPAHHEGDPRPRRGVRLDGGPRSSSRGAGWTCPPVW